MLTEWLCGTDVAGPDRSVISLNHSQNQISMQLDREPAETSMTTQAFWQEGKHCAVVRALFLAQISDA